VVKKLAAFPNKFCYQMVSPSVLVCHMQYQNIYHHINQNIISNILDTYISCVQDYYFIPLFPSFQTFGWWVRLFALVKLGWFLYEHWDELNHVNHTMFHHSMLEPGMCNVSLGSHFKCV
jgi:hypothetical protein